MNNGMLIALAFGALFLYGIAQGAIAINQSQLFQSFTKTTTDNLMEYLK